MYPSHPDPLLPIPSVLGRQSHHDLHAQPWLDFGSGHFLTFLYGLDKLLLWLAFELVILLLQAFPVAQTIGLQH